MIVTVRSRNNLERASRVAAAAGSDAVSPPAPNARIPDKRTSSPSVVANVPPSKARAKLTTRAPFSGHSGALAIVRLAASDSWAAIPDINMAASTAAHVPVRFCRMVIAGVIIRRRLLSGTGHEENSHAPL